MSNYDPNRVVQDFAERTWSNYEFIKEQYWLEQPDRKVYNVTQLVNSRFAGTGEAIQEWGGSL